MALKPFDSAGAWLPAVETSGLRRRAVRGAGITRSFWLAF
jgi:hypothetical protein